MWCKDVAVMGWRPSMQVCMKYRKTNVFDARGIDTR